MAGLRRTCAAVLAVSYAAFFRWHGSSSEPVTPEWVASKTECGFEAMAVGLDRIMAQEDTGESFLMMNLVKYRAEPYYPDPALRPDWVVTGADADQYYSSKFLPKVIARAGYPVAMSSRVWFPVMAPQNSTDALGVGERWTNWDCFAVVRYRSRRDFLEAICEVNKELGPGAMSQLKHSGVERTYVVPVVAPMFSHVVRALVAVPVLISLKVLLQDAKSKHE